MLKMSSVGFNVYPRIVPSRTDVSVQNCRESCGEYDKHPQCDGEVLLGCQQELHTQGFLGVLTGKNPEDSIVPSVEAMQWIHLGHERCYISHSAA
jgi:hypothetical protein